MVEEKSRLLTARNVNQLARQLLSAGGSRERVAQLKNDWRAFVESEFRLSKQQKENLRKIPAGVVGQIHSAIRAALDQNGELEVAFASNAERSVRIEDTARGKLTIIGRAGSPEISDVRAMALKIPIIECTFGADCGDWDCGPPI